DKEEIYEKKVALWHWSDVGLSADRHRRLGCGLRRHQRPRRDARGLCVWDTVTTNTKLKNTDPVVSTNSADICSGDGLAIEVSSVTLDCAKLACAGITRASATGWSSATLTG